MRFATHALTMASGTAIAQIVAVAALPILSRLYSPAELGALGAVIALASVMSMLITGRIELAIVLPKDDAVAIDLAKATLALATALSGLLLLCMVALNASGRGYDHWSSVGDWIFMAPLLALVSACGSTLSQIANRGRRYFQLARAVVLQQGIFAIAAMLLGSFGLGRAGLFLARACAHIGFAASFMKEMGSIVRAGRTRPRTGFRALCSQYKQFPMYNLPYSLTGALSRDFLIIAFTSIGAVSAAGFYTLARAVVTAPVGFVSSSLNSVYYREAADHWREERFARFTYALLLASALAAAPAFAWFSTWAEPLFVFAFGETWRGAGHFAAILAVPAALSVLTSWTDRIFEIRNKQQWSFTIQIACDVITLATAWLVLQQGGMPETAVFWFAMTQIGFHLIYLLGVFRLARLDLGRYAGLIGALVFQFACVLVLGRVVQSWDALMLEKAIAHGICALAVMAIAYLILWRFLSPLAYRFDPPETEPLGK